MKIGMVGLGRMGSNMTRRLVKSGHAVVVYDVDGDAVDGLVGEGAFGATSLESLVDQLGDPAIVWVMLPSGAVTEGTIGRLRGLLDAGDVLIDGGNSRYTDSLERARAFGENGISFVDAGTSGGVWGLDHGYALMVGAEEGVFETLRPIFSALAPENGYARVGGPGSGHFVKMVHNGVEYALMQAYAEGFELLRAGPFDLDVAQVAELWRHGSVVRSWLLDLAASALRKDPGLDNLSGWVDDSGEGRWTLEEALDNAVPAPALAAALFARFGSRQQDSYANRLLAALRQEFGGHAIRANNSSAA